MYHAIKSLSSRTFQDDDKETANLLSLYLEKEPYRVVWASSGADGLRIAATELPDLITLDLNMPDMSGQEVCRRLREQQLPFRVPVVILTSDPQIAQQSHCVGDLGADDYIVKMPNPLQIKAKLKSLIQGVRLGCNPQGIFRIGDVTLDTSQMTMAVSGTGVKFTEVETALVSLLMSARGKYIDKDLLHKKWKRSWPQYNSSTIKVHISSIRTKLGAHKQLIESRRDGGYRFNVEYASRLSDSAQEPLQAP